MEAVILAGGKGLRLGSISKKTPKSMVEIGEKPLLEHQINLLSKYKIKRIWILLGYLGEKIQNYFGDGRKFKIRINYLLEKTPLGTARAIGQLRSKIKSDFLVLSGDVMADFDINRFIKFHKKNKGAVCTIIVHPNDHPFDSDLVEVDANYRVITFVPRVKKAQAKGILFHNLTNAGIFIFSKKIFNYIEDKKKSDLEKDLFPLILKSRRKIFAYNTCEYFKDMGTPKRLAQVRKDYKSGKIQKKNLRNKQKTIFLDRDGTLNDQDGKRDVRLIDFRLFSYTARAIKKINQTEYLTIIVTNQPAIAKGFITPDESDKIGRKLETELGLNGAKIDATYFCPHHPESGFEGEVKELKINCLCRKPKIELIRRAVKNFNIDLNRSFFIGDSTVDAKCAENAGIKFIGVKTGYALSDNRYEVNKQIIMKNNLLSAVNYVLKNGR